MRCKAIHKLMPLVLALAFATVVSAQGQASDNDEPLTNAGILKLVRAGFKEKTMIAIINARPPAYDLSPDKMIELKKSGVNEHVILAMLNRQKGLSAYGDDNWENDPFFQDKREKGKTNQSRDQKETDIFGSSGSSQGSTKSTGSGTVESGADTQTTGTATVRIIRPPSEAAAPMKLEKTASLTNDSIIELVEAGFSEGTIVRRIEQSPVDFDLSPGKVADLKKHRVGDKIITAMRAAMGDDTNLKNSSANPNGASKP
jgi:hypothetical protein